MMKAFVYGLLCGVLLFICYPAYADTVSDLTEDYTAAGVPGQEQAAPSGFHGILGAGLFNVEKIVGDSDRKTVPLPLIIITYKDLAYWSLGGGGVWLLQSDDRSLKLGVGVKVRRGWKADDDPDLAGMADRHTSLDGSVNALWKTSVVNINASYYHDILNVSNGEAATLRLSRNFWIEPKFRLTPSVGVEWQSAKLVDYYYGVRPAEATANRLAYNGRDTVNVGAGLGGAYRLSPDWSLMGGVYTTHLGSGITDSPIVSHRFSTLVFFGAGWLF
ncbi:MAG: MipA/OmpV family protein [Nitrospirota bacterium]